MMGSGTTLVEARLLNRNAIGVDINLNSVMLTRDRLNFSIESLFSTPKDPVIKTFLGDARNLDKIENETIDLTAIHPPYANIISYSTKKTNSCDLSNLPLPKYICEMKNWLVKCSEC